VSGLYGFVIFKSESRFDQRCPAVVAADFSTRRMLIGTRELNPVCQRCSLIYCFQLFLAIYATDDYGQIQKGGCLSVGDSHYSDFKLYETLVFRPLFSNWQSYARSWNHL